MRPCMAAHKMPVVVHGLDYFLSFFDFSAHEEKAHLDIALTQPIKKPLGIFSGAVVKGEGYLLFAV